MLCKSCLDKKAINAIIKQVAGKTTADSVLSSTAKAQKETFRTCLKNKRKPWMPDYFAFPMRSYDRDAGLEAISRWKTVEASINHVENIICIDETLEPPIEANTSEPIQQVA